MATRDATARFREPSAMQLNHIGLAEDANKKTGRCLLVDLCATEFSDWTRSASRSHRHILLVPVIVVAAARGSAQSSSLR
jgi:hypothetical protein